MEKQNKPALGLSHPSFKAWAVVTCAALFFGYQFTLRVTPNVINEELMQILSIDSTELGFVLAYYNWAYAGMQLPLGIMMDRIGPRIFIAAGAILCAFSCFLFAFVETVFMASLARFLIGLGSACGFIGTLKLGTLWFDSKDMGKVIALTYTLGTFGAMLGGAPVRLLYDNFGFVTMMQVLGFAGVVISALTLLIVHNQPKGEQHPDMLQIYENKHPIHDLWFVIKNPQSWYIGLYSMLMYAPVAIVGDAWGVQFLEKACGLEDIVAPLLVSTMFVGAAIGSPLSATLSDVVQNRKLPMLLGSVLTFAVYVMIVGVKGIPLITLYILFFTAGFAYASKGIGFAVICEIMPKKISGVSIAFINTAVMLAGSIFLPLVGFLLELHWDGTMVAGAPHYTEDNYRFAFWVIPITLIVSSLLVLLIKESHPARSVVKQYGHNIDPDVI
jgi:sugar phosphate permease